MSGREAKVMSSVQACLEGAWRFGVVSLAGYAVWAWGGGWLYKQAGEVGLYTACALVFLALAGLLMHPLLAGRNRIRRFYRAFVPAFLVYAVVWTAFWFALQSNLGEWLGSLLGCFVFTVVFGKLLGTSQKFLMVAAVVFLAHSAGYFAGSYIFGAQQELFGRWGLSKPQIGVISKLVWGFCYGLGFGGGIGYAVHQFQKPLRSPLL